MMNTGLKTARGANVTVHFGKITTTNLWEGKWKIIDDVSVIAQLKAACRAYARTGNNDDIRNIGNRVDYPSFTRPYIRGLSEMSFTPTDNPSSVAEPVTEPKTTEAPAPAGLTAIEKKNLAGLIRKFFSEFTFKPNARFVNTLANMRSVSEIAAYTVGYTKLINNPDAGAIEEKIKSPEWNEIADKLCRVAPSKKINNRLSIYFGDAGTGKTTAAITENPGAPVVTCNASILPDELLRTFDFNDESGNPVFKPSTLRNCMVEGKPIIFDEINLLSFDCLRLLQTLTDGKENFDYNGETVAIKDGFKIIGTMNLVVNEQVYSLPDPLVDRAMEIKEFILSDKDLAVYAFD